MNSFPRWLLVASGLAILILMCAGAWFYLAHEQRLKQDAQDNLLAIAQLKAEQIAKWRADQLAQAAVIAERPSLEELAQQWFADPKPEIREKILARLKSVQERHGYRDVMLIDANGQGSLSLRDPVDSFSEHVTHYLPVAFRDRQPLMTDLHAGPGHLPPHVDLIAPLLGGGKTAEKPIGAILIRIDARQFLYPLVQFWPTPSRTAETLLVRREGDSVLFLNDLRHKPDVALKLRIPLSRKDVPAVMAVLGKEGVVTGTDYREVDVISALKAVPNSPWFMVAKVDAAEILARSRVRAVLGGLLLLSIAAFLAASIGMIWQRNQKHHYRSLFQAEAARRQHREALQAVSSRLEAILAAVPDIIMQVDANKVYTWANQAGLEFFGDDVIGKEASYYFEGEQETYEKVAPLFQGDDNVIYIESWQRRRDGQKRLLGWWCRSLKDRSGNTAGALSSARDITNAHIAVQALGKERAHLRTLVQTIPDLVWLKDPDGVYITCNPVFERFFGAKEADIVGKTDYDYVDAELAAFFRRKDREAMAAGRPSSNEEWITFADDGHRALLDTIKTPMYDSDGKLIGVLGIARDITSLRQAEQDLRDSEERYRKLVELLPVGIRISVEGKFVFANTEMARIIGLAGPEEAIGRRILDFVHPDYYESIKDRIRRVIEQRKAVPTVEEKYVRPDGTVVDVEVGARPITYMGNPASMAVVRDITEKKRAEEIIRVRVNLLEFAASHSVEEFLRYTLDEVGALVNSPIGFYHFVHGDQETLTLQAWSTKTLKEFCRAKGKGMHYPIDQAGVWVDCVREKRPVIHNDYASLPHRKGMPEGHAVVVRELVVPIMRSGRTVAVLGVGNKPADYTEQDVEAVSYLADVAWEITESRLAQKALRESEKRFRMLYEQSPSPYQSLDSEGRLLDVNNAWLAELGYEREEVIGKWFGDFLAGEGPALFRERFQQFKARGEIHGVEFKINRKDGTAIVASFEGSVGRDDKGAFLQTHCVFTNVTERRKAEAERMRLASAIEQAAEVVVITDTEGIVRYVNPAFEKVTGYTREEAIGQNPRFLKSGEHDKAFYKQLWDTILRGDTWSGRLINRRKDGRIFYEEATISPVKDTSGKITDFVAVKRDITAHLELSNQLFQAQKMEAIGTLAGGVAHDFNNILQVVLGYSDLVLTDEDLPAQYKEDLGRINQAARNGADLVQRLLTFSRKTETKPLPLNLNRRIEQLKKMLSRTIPKMVTIELALAADLAAINADPVQVDQVLMNLALNASDAMPDGGRLIIETENAALDKDYAKTHLDAKPGRYVLLRVSDTGSGIDKETLKHIFEPFFTTKGPAEGTGLGLAMVYGIVKQHNGHIMCYSEPSRGTTFKIYFPALVAADESPEVETKTMPQGGSETILVVDDEEYIRELAARILSRAGYRVMAATDGKEALDVYRAQRQEIGLVLLDLVMPEMGGKQCLERLLAVNPAVKVVITSGYSADGMTGAALQLGAKGFVDKPFDVRQVLEVVRSVLDA